MTVYLDACCLNRLTDDQSQSRIRAEAEVVEVIFKRMRAGEIQWISSEALVDEIERNPQPERRLENVALLSLASSTAGLTDAVVDRAGELEAAGYGAYDALHLAFAEASQVDVLFTTDDDFLRRALRKAGSPLVPVMNPLFWSRLRSI